MKAPDDDAARHSPHMYEFGALLCLLTVFPENLNVGALDAVIRVENVIDFARETRPARLGAVFDLDRGDLFQESCEMTSLASQIGSLEPFQVE